MRIILAAIAALAVFGCSGPESTPVVRTTDDHPAEMPRTVAAPERTPKAPTPAQASPQTTPSPEEATASTAPQLPSDPVQTPTVDALDEAMSGFLRALAEKDVERFLLYFSRSKSFRYINTLEAEHRVVQIDYEELARDLRTRDVERGWYSFLFEGGPDEAFAQAVVDPDGRPWKKVGKRRFVRPEDDADSTLFVLWRRDGARWVVEAIGYPAA